ncbi:MAG: glycosyltransferase family 2 protein [Gammaproteobacteria bacterium]
MHISIEKTSPNPVPAISIVMAAYNEERDIGKAIESVLAQSFEDWELIVIDDGSTDSTANVLRSFAERDDRIRLICNETNIQLSASLNKGVGLARAELIARADADDINLPDRLQSQFDYFQLHDDVDVLGTGAYMLDKAGDRVNSVSLPQSHDELAQLPFLKTHFFHPSVMMRKRFFEVAGYYDTSYLRAEDKELWLRGISVGCRYANLPEPLIEYSTDGYVRSWASINSKLSSFVRMVRKYNVKNGYAQVLMSFVVSMATKFRLYKPKSVRSNGKPVS